MYKSRLQELCQQRMWALPEYTSSRDGPDHNPRFRASVTVAGLSFDSPDFAKSSKEAQNKAAQAAVDHFAAAAPPAAAATSPALSDSLLAEVQISYKSLLQNYVQRKDIDLLEYAYVCEGSSHAPCYKATVNVGGKIFSTPQSFKTLKEAEQAAAKLAWTSLSGDENQQDELNQYKNLLQQLAQREGFSLPKYTTVSRGASCIPVFSSTVEIEGEHFEGDVAKTKKQAEMSAAMVAWCRFRERKARIPGLSLSSRVQEDLESASSRSMSGGVPSLTMKNLERPKVFSVPISSAKNKEEIEKITELTTDQEDAMDEIAVEKRSSTVTAAASSEGDQGILAYKNILIGDSVQVDKSATSLSKLDSECSKETMINANSAHVSKSATPVRMLDSVITIKKEGSLENALAIAGTPPPPTTSKGFKEIMMNGNGHVDKLDKSLCKLALDGTKEEEAVTSAIAQDVTLTPSAPSDSSEVSCADANAESPIGGPSCSLLCKRVRVYPRKPDMVLPEGASLLPFSDDMWVAVSLDFSKP